MVLDEVPVNRLVPEQGVDVLVAGALVGPVEDQVVPVPDPGKQVEPQSAASPKTGSDWPCVSAWIVSGWTSLSFLSRPSMM